MKVFLSWYGSTSQAIAQALHNWLPLVIQGSEPWMSEIDIEPGMRGYNEITQQLAEINVGILCLTSENLEAPWILYQAGALSKALDSSRVIPYLFNANLMDPSSPLSQFRAVRADQNGTWKMLQTVNRARSDTNIIPEQRLGILFERLWPDLETSLGRIGINQPIPFIELNQQQVFASPDERVSADKFFSTRTPEESIISQAKQEIWLVQETGSLVIEQNLKTLEMLIKQGGIVKILVASNAPQIVEFIALRNKNLTSQQIGIRQKDAAEKMRSLTNATSNISGLVEIKQIDYPLDVTAIYIDPESTQATVGMALVRMVGFKNYFPEKRDFVLLRAKEPETFEYFAKQFREMWNLARLYEL